MSTTPYNEKEIAEMSKLLSYVLRHHPEHINIELDEQGWVSVERLLAQLNKHGHTIDQALLNHVVETNSKKRFAFSSDQQNIRASQGHSISVDLKYEPQVPPDILFHGTATRFLTSILEFGLIKQNRQHIHLSAEFETAVKVGQRHGKPFVLNVLAGEMHKQGYQFFLSENGVWLTDQVPSVFLSQDKK